MLKKRVVVLTTGGTIATKLKKDIRNVGYTGEQLVGEFPELREIAEIEVEEVMNILSENMIPSDWQKIARDTKKYILRDDIDGVVITHGTDTLIYTSGALSLMLQNLNKPIVMTGSMVSIDEDKKHVRRHLVDSVFAAAYSDIPEVMVCFSGDERSTFTNLYRGSRVKIKNIYVTKYNALDSLGEEPIAKIDNKKMVFLSPVHKRHKEGDLVFNDSLDPRVSLLSLFPGTDLSLQHQLEFCYKNHNIDGIVIEVYYRDGSFLDNSRNIRVVEKTLNAGIFIVVTSRVSCATLARFKSDRKLKKSGVIPLGDMISEKAIVKLMWVLAQTKEFKKVKEKMQFNYAGEITPRSYLNLDKK